MTKSVFVPNGQQKQIKKDSVFVEHIKNKQTLGERFVYDSENFSTQKKSEYTPNNKS